MSARKAERLLNLTILLLTARTYVTKEQIRAATEPYQQAGDEAFEKMFERDKEELRASGVPIEIGSIDAYFDDEQGYRISRDAFELPEIEFSPEEAALLGVAARVWQQAGLTAHTDQAITKLRAAGVQVERDALSDLSPRLVANEAAFTPTWEATMNRQVISFDYRKAGDLTAERRTLHPYRVTSTQDRWYVVGHDVDRGGPRMFRLSRIEGDVTLVGRPGAFRVPADVDLDALTAQLAPAPRRGDAVLLVRQGQALAVRRRARLLEEGLRGGPEDEDSWDRMSIALFDLDREARALQALGPAVIVEEPAELRKRVVDAMRACLDGMPPMSAQ